MYGCVCGQNECDFCMHMKDYQDTSYIYSFLILGPLEISEKKNLSSLVSCSLISILHKITHFMNLNNP